jgi:saccharopine dehydrogenase-like NADP-dependent oxidoreductase
MKYVVLGGAGAIGSVIVKDMVETCPPSDKIVVADYDYAKAKALAASLRSPRVRAAPVNVRDKASTARALRGAFAVINSVPYELNLSVMDAALAARAHYIDLGGLFHVTRKQLKLGRRFKAVGRTALLCMGNAPGITNLLARDAADRLDKVREIHVRVGLVDQTRYRFKPPLKAAYSMKTIMEEFAYEPAVFTSGKFKFVEPMSGYEPYRFPNPVGLCRPMYTIHSEVATLPLSFKRKGVKEVSFKIAFDPGFIDRVRFLRDVGMGSHVPIQAGGVKVRPIDVLDRVVMSQPASRPIGKRKQYKITRVIVKGTKDGKKVTWFMDSHTSGKPAWGIGLEISVGSPLSIAAQMLANGEISAKGVVFPELAVPPDLCFKYLRKRGVRVKATRKRGWVFST